MRRAILPILFLLIIPFVPSVAFANIIVSLSDGVATVAKTTAGPTATEGFNLTMPAPKFSAVSPTSSGNQTLMLLGDCTTTSQTGCARARYFPSGKTTAQVNGVGGWTGPSDTFKIQDISSTNRARIEKTDVPSGGTADTGADTLILRGIKIFALAITAGQTRTLTIIYQTTSGDFTQITSSTGNYAATAKLSGQFRLDTTSPINGESGAIAGTCTAGVSSPCLKLKLEVNALTLNGGGSSTVLTTSLPCSTNSASPDYSVAPCGSGGFWDPNALGSDVTGTPGDDQFSASDSGTVGCGTTCNPVHKGTFTATFSALNQVVTLSNSVGLGMAAETLDGLISLAEQLGDPGVDQWLASCSGKQRYQVVGLPPFNTTGRNQNDSANFPAKFSLKLADLVPASGGFTLESVVDPVAEAVLPPADQLKNDTCFMTWVPSAPRPMLGDIDQFTLTWGDFRVGDFASTDPRLGTLTYSDCIACYRVEIELLNNDKNRTPAGKLKIYLGADATATGDPKVNHDGTAPFVDFFSASSGFRVDGSGVPSKLTACCITFAEARKASNYGKFLVRAVTVVLDSGEDPPPVSPDQLNHQVTSVAAALSRSNDPEVSSSSSQLLVVAPNPAPSCDWPPIDGLVMQVYKVDAGVRTWVETVVDTRLEDFGCTLRADIDVTKLVGAGTYEVVVSAFSGASDPNAEFVGGIALQSPGIMILK